MVDDVSIGMLGKVLQSNVLRRRSCVGIAISEITDGTRREEPEDASFFP